MTAKKVLFHKASSKVGQLLGNMAQSDYDDVYLRIRSGEYMALQAMDHPEWWVERCLEDLQVAKARAPEDYPFIERPWLDFEKLNKRLSTAAKRARR